MFLWASGRNRDGKWGKIRFQVECCMSGAKFGTMVKVISASHSVMSDSCDPHGLYSPWNSPGQNTRVERLALLQGNLPNPGIEPRSPTLQADSLPAELSGKLKVIRESQCQPGPDCREYNAGS